MSPIPVIYIITKLELGGAQKVCLTLLKNVPSATYTTALIAGAGGLLDSSVSQNPQVQLLPEIQREITLTSLRGLWNEIKGFIRLVQILRALRAQHPRAMVHTHSTKAGILGRWAAWCAGIKVRIHTVHGYAFHDHQSRMLWWAIYLIELITSLITTHFICVSSHDAQLGTRLFPGFVHKYTIIRAAIAWDTFQAAQKIASIRDPQQQHYTITPAQKTEFVIGTVACFKPQKNLFDLLRAFHWVSQHTNGIRCEIIGDGTLRPALEAWISAHGLTNRVILHGWQDDVATIMATWDLFVLTSLWEGLPCATVEARMLGLPVFAYQTGGIGDIITSEKNGMLYPQGAWQELAEGIYRCTYDITWHTTLAQHQDQLDDFRDTAMVAQHQQLYDRLQQ